MHNFHYIATAVCLQLNIVLFVHAVWNRPTVNPEICILFDFPWCKYFKLNHKISVTCQCRKFLFVEKSEQIWFLINCIYLNIRMAQKLHSYCKWVPFHFLLYYNNLYWHMLDKSIHLIVLKFHFFSVTVSCFFSNDYSGLLKISHQSESTLIDILSK